MASDHQLIEQLAADLWQAQESKTPIPRLSTAHPELDIDGAYSVQEILSERRRERGEHIVGHKVGLTSEAIQKQLGVHQPDSGIITDAMIVPDGGTLHLRDHIAPRLEPEFAFYIGDALPPDSTIEQVRSAITEVALSIEIIDSRVCDWDIGIIDTVADNASSAGAVLGPRREATPELLKEIIGTEISFSDGQRSTTGPGAAVLGDPVAAVHWLVGTIGARGRSIGAGEVILAGAVTAAVTPLTGSRWQASAPGFDPVTIEVVA